MRNRSQPTGSSKVRPFFGIPRLLSSSMFLGASGRPDLFLPNHFLLELPTLSFHVLFFLTGFGSVPRLRTLAAFNFSLAVNLDLFGTVCIGSVLYWFGAEMDPLEGLGVFFVGSISEVLSVVSVARRSPFATKRGLLFLVCVNLLTTNVLKGDEKLAGF
ncbi:hypothetical protein Tco_1475791 [Tanacetum coccineum]